MSAPHCKLRSPLVHANEKRSHGAATVAGALLIVWSSLLVQSPASSSQGASAIRATARVAQAPTRVDGPVRRIVSLVPAATEMIFAMGAGDRVVGVSSFDRFPPEVASRPQVGGLLDPNVERILSLRPDLVVLYRSQGELQQQLARARIAVFEYTHRDLSDVTQTLRLLGARIGAPGAEATATDIERQLAAIRSQVAGRPRPKTLLIIGREPESLRQLRASGGYGFLHDLLELAGGEDVWRDVPRESIEMSPEMVLARAPEAIIELHYGQSVPASRLAAERGVWKTLASVPAVRSDRIYLLLGDEFVVPGPRVVRAAEQFARTLHPEAFAGGR
jgi:iron complex transport system substrate-binding protein